MRASVLSWLMVAVGGCAIPYGTLPLGATCTSSHECISGICLASAQGQTEGVCAVILACTVDNDGNRSCPDGGTCEIAHVIRASTTCQAPCPAVPAGWFCR